MKISSICKCTLCALLGFCIGTRAFAQTAAAPGAEPLSAQVPVLMYHSLYAGGGDMWVISPAEFEQDLRYLQEQGYQAVGLSDLQAFVAGGAPLPEKPVMLTFDDGYYNNLTQALPLLEVYDMKMVLSIIGEYTDLWSETDEAMSEEYSHLGWEQLNTLLESGRVELSNHTQNLHRNQNGRSGCVPKQGEDPQSYRRMLIEDVGGLQAKIREHCGAAPVCFAYPFGNKAPETLEILRELGFAVTLSCYGGMNRIVQGEPDCLYDLHRDNRTSDMTAQMLLEKMEAAL